MFTDNCNAEFSEYDGYCYILDTREMSKDAAENECIQYPDGHLVSFHSQREYNFILAITK